MITKSKLLQLEKKFTKTRMGKKGIVWRMVDENRRLVDENEFVMTEDEVRLVKKEDKMVREMGNIIFCEILTHSAKLKPGSAVNPYCTKLNKYL